MMPPSFRFSRLLRPSPVGARRLALAGLLAAAGATLRAEIEFVGVLSMSERTFFAVADTATQRTDWVPLGGIFAGHRLASYRAEEETLTLVRDGTETRIRLKPDAKVKPERIELSGTLSLGQGDAVEVTRVTLQYDRENVFPLRDGYVCRIVPERREDGSIAYRASFERTLGENKREAIQLPLIVTLPGRPFSVRVDDIGFSFTPRSA